LLELATGTAVALLPSVISAAAAIAAALLVVRQNSRAQSYEQLLRDVKTLLEDSEKRIDRAVKKALRRVLGTRTPHRRFYESDEDDDDLSDGS
jgi:hypothetical protein